jgi:hypothetical protein
MSSNGTLSAIGSAVRFRTCRKMVSWAGGKNKMVRVYLQLPDSMAETAWKGGAGWEPAPIARWWFDHKVWWDRYSDIKDWPLADGSVACAGKCLVVTGISDEGMVYESGGCAEPSPCRPFPCRACGESETLWYLLDHDGRCEACVIARAEDGKRRYVPGDVLCISGHPLEVEGGYDWCRSCYCIALGYPEGHCAECGFKKALIGEKCAFCTQPCS